MNFFRKSSPAAGKPEFIIACLGNPGKKYERTRHNTGFIFADVMSSKYSFRITKIQFKSITGTVKLGGHSCLVMKPQTFMNESGNAVREAAAFYKIPPENILVVFDDISLPVGKMRIRRKGSDGGHNGIKSIIYHLNSDNFPRIKIGVGEKPVPQMDLADWVLSSFGNDELKTLIETAEKACEAAELIVSGETDKAMSNFNS